ncbi:CubicO group peptidase, beta-lactamase class C family [Bradyrhizobium brasilense]|uniref:CubicO group peptidase, beta-lactamase class C family n=1 Tax=Bradyrhizobium brasilense TaxID=1419277 RepID=A0A1G7K7W5_9BRAD|nr:serine hydrolase [Bradyrhizobium brasilense]SDF32959.1 CubicO group peptidase, beta-lactamase class C family [Bradyrhizobium brasilense]
MFPSAAPPPALSEDAIRRLLIERVDERCLSVGMVVGVTDADGRRIAAHGFRDTSGAGPVNEKTLFEIGSITKLFTALLLSDMANRGEVRMDEPVSELLPAGTRVPVRDGKAITLRDLASHYSGLPRVATNGDPPDRPAGPYAAYTAERLYQFLASHELVRTPGDSFEYSNVGVGLLGHALVLRAGASGYESLIRTPILDPLRMDDTVIAIPARLAANIASGHNDSLEPTSDWTFDVLAGTGALRSTMLDLLRFVEAVYNRSSSIAPIIPPLMTPRDQGGLELAKTHLDGVIALSKPGGTGGVRGFVKCIPEWKRGVVVLSNASIDAVVDLGAHSLNPRRDLVSYPKEVAIDPICLARLVGRYQMNDWVFAVTATGDRLHVPLGDQNRVFPTSEWHFFHKSAPVQLTFEPGGDGRAIRLILHSNGTDRIAERIGVEERYMTTMSTKNHREGPVASKADHPATLRHRPWFKNRYLPARRRLLFAQTLFDRKFVDER